MLKGTIAMTSDPQVLATAIYSGCIVVCMKESLERDEYLGPNPIYASVLLPQYEAVSAYLDGNDQLAKSFYASYLSTREPDMYICSLIAASIKGLNVLIYIDKDMYEMGFVQIFYMYLIGAYGVYINVSPDTNFSFDPNFTTVVLSTLYMYDLMDMGAFFAMYPQGVPLERYVVPKLVSEFNPFSMPRSQEDYYNYFMAYKENMKLNGFNQPLINPFITNGEV